MTPIQPLRLTRWVAAVVLTALALALVLSLSEAQANEDYAGWYGPLSDGCSYYWDGYQWTGDIDCSGGSSYAAGWYDGGDGCWYYYDGYGYTGDYDCGGYGLGWYGPYADGCSYYWDGWGWTGESDCGGVVQVSSVWGDDGCSYYSDGSSWYREGCLTTDGVYTYWWDVASATWWLLVEFSDGSAGWMELFPGESVQSGPYTFTGGGSGQTGAGAGDSNTVVIGGGDVPLSPGLVLTGDPATDAILIANHNSTIDTILAPPCNSSYNGCA